MKECKKKMNLPVTWKIFCGILSVLLISTVTVIATDESSGTNEAGTISASADGYAEGDFASVTTEATASDEGAHASALAEASASNGGTAIAESTSQANYLDIASAYAHAIATAISQIGETTWARAYTEAIASPDGSASSKSTSIVWSAGYNGGNGGDNGGTDPGNGGNGGGTDPGNGGNGGGTDPGNGGDNGGRPVIAKQPVIIPQHDVGMFGFSFGKSDPGRYYYFKRVTNYNITALRLADNNTANNGTTNYSRARAKDFMWQIAWDRGMNETQFENKFREENYTKEVEDIISKYGMGIVT